MDYEAALDFSTTQAYLCVRGVFSAQRTFTRRQSGDLHCFIAEAFAAHGVAFDAVRRWFIASGPGSFTTLRIAAALVQGYARGCKEPAEVFGVPSALGIVGRLPPREKLRAAVLYDARNKELLYYGMVYENGAWHSTGDNGVCALEQCAILREKFDVLCADSSLKTLLEDTVVFIDEPDVERYFESVERRGADDLIYLRPAVFVAPSVIRQDLPL